MLEFFIHHSVIISVSIFFSIFHGNSLPYLDKPDPVERKTISKPNPKNF